MALDIGEVRTGIAVSDSAGRVAHPLKVLPTSMVITLASSFRVLLDDYEPGLLLVGLPLSLDGTENEQAERVRTLAGALGRSAQLPLEFADERLSSREAKRILREQGCTEREMRGKIDAVAASLFLQTWLDAGRANDAHSLDDRRDSNSHDGCDSNSK
jgi:putative Holliday junction resolvase